MISILTILEERYQIYPSIETTKKLDKRYETMVHRTLNVVAPNGDPKR